MNSEDPSELWETQTQTQTPSLSKSPPEAKDVWGRLDPIILHVPSMDLFKQIYTLGRSDTCDVSLKRANLPDHLLRSVSKYQFRIERCFEENTTSITDLSKNGTYLNGRIIGHQQTILIQHDDKIGMPMDNKIQRIYSYKATDNTVKDILPPVLKQQYILGHILGKGTFGQVRLLIERRTGVRFAVKIILKVHFDEMESKKLENEVNILKTLSHPCIVSMKDFVETNDSVFIVLEYMKGGELLGRIKETMPESTVKFIFYQLIVGVKYLHLNNIAHRDIKPGNILLKSCDDEPLVKISDFGLSRIMERSMKSVCGTPYFVAPEIVNPNFKKYSELVDVWSLGVMLYYMLSTDLPFYEEDKDQLYPSIMKGRFIMDLDNWISISDEAMDLVHKMLVVDPTERITISEIFEHPWISEDDEVIDRAKLLIKENMNEVDSNCDPVQNPEVENPEVVENDEVEVNWDQIKLELLNRAKRRRLEY